MVINVQCTSFITIWNDKKMLFALARLVLAFGLFWDFFGLQKAFGLFQAKKFPKTALRSKQPGCSKKKVCPSSC